MPPGLLSARLPSLLPLEAFRGVPAAEGQLSLDALVYDLAPLFHELTNAPGAIVRCQVQYR